MCAFSVIIKKTFPIQRWFTPISSSRSFIVLALTFKSLNHFELILYKIWDRFQLISFVCGFSVLPESFVGKTVLFSLNCIGTLIYKAVINLKVYFWNHCCSPFIYACSYASTKFILVVLYKFVNGELWILQLCSFSGFLFVSFWNVFLLCCSVFHH